jgi:WD40 repeat protein
LNDQPDSDVGNLDIDLARRIDVICRRFEADWRDGRQPSVEDYLNDIPEGGRAALRVELEALLRELRPPGVSEIDPAAGARRPPSTIAEAQTVAPGTPVAMPVPGEAIHDEATVPPRDPATVDLGSSAPASPEAGTPSHVRYFGDYEIIREIARGGMGVVFEARQLSLNRKVALKMILAGQLANDTDVKRFYSEAEAAANLDHPGIVPIFEVGQHEGQHYFSMGFVAGQSLAYRLADGPLPVREAAELIRRASEAIEYAHQRGVVHRDLKPANILIDQNGNPRITDFGLAKRTQTDSGLTGSGQIMGTPSYMPPEQAGANRAAVGPAADVYALGATCYALVTGRPPFQAATAMDTVLQVLSDEPVSLRRLIPAVPRDLETICLKCLEKDPKRRYSSARALADELNRFLSGEPIVARPVGSAERAMKWVRRRPVIAGLIALVAGTGLLGLSGIVWQWREAVAARIYAQDQAGIAKNQSRIATEQAGIARRNENAARNAAEFANRRLYDVKMNVVQRSWEDWSPTLFLGTLNDQRPENEGGIDRRGFEWFYWQRKVSSGHITLKGRTGQINGVAFSPDGTRLASAGSDGMVRAWDAATGLEARSFKGHTNQVTSVAFSPDGKRLASAGWDLTVRVWDAATGLESHRIKAHTQAVECVAFSPDGNSLASASQDGTVKLWDAATALESHTLAGHSGPVVRVAFSPDGKHLASAGAEGTVKVWNPATRRETLSLKGHMFSIISVAFSPDGKRLASASQDGTVKVRDAVTGLEIRTLNWRTNLVWSVAFSPDGKRLACVGYDGTVKVCDADTGRETLTLKGHSGPVGSLSFSTDSRRLASAGSDGTVSVWDTATGQETLTLKMHDVRVLRDAFSVLSVAFSPDGKRLASASGDGTVKVWDSRTGREIRTLIKGNTGYTTRVAFSPDGERLASVDDNGTVKVWAAAIGQEALTLKGDSVASRMAFSPDGTRLASAGTDKSVKVWDVATGQEIRALKGHVGFVYCAAFSPDGTRIASSDGQGEIKIWAIESAQVILAMNNGPSYASCVAYSPDSTRLASTCLDGTVKVWDAATGREILTLRGHTGAVESVAFSPDSQRLASASRDLTVKVWDVMTGQETLTLKGHISQVNSVAFSPDGHLLASASQDVTVKLWDARPLDDEPATSVSSSR